MKKYLLRPERLRRIPEQFSWIDHRLISDKHLSRCSHGALGLYLFLVTVADSQGLSFYGDTTIMGLLKMTREQLTGTRRQLIHADLIVYECPLYQVLALDDGKQVDLGSAKRTGKALTLQEILTPITA